MAAIPYTCEHVRSFSLKDPQDARTTFLIFLCSYGMAHNTYQRTGSTGVLYTFIDNVPRVLVKEMKEQPGKNSEAKTGNLGAFNLLWKFGS